MGARVENCRVDDLSMNAAKDIGLLAVTRMAISDELTGRRLAVVDKTF